MPTDLETAASRRITTEDLVPEELEALRAAGAWYAKYHAVRLAELADDPSAYAEHKREKFRLSQVVLSASAVTHTPACARKRQ